ncbi:MAG: HAMP domain-containing histidine kinase [Lachnospiraceae bacterium]|nr:HAMP domain-containing histidine kinase [Lachnospiraceae bacterium]
MKKINRIIFLTVMSFLLLMCLVNIYLSQNSFQHAGREYRVSINRIEKAVTAFEKEKRRAPANLEELMQYAGVEEYPQVTGLYTLASDDNSKEETARFLGGETADYAVFVTEEYYYKVTYAPEGQMKGQIIMLVNGISFCMLVIVLAFLFYIKQKILLPFYRLSEIPFQLSKGNLTIPLLENKNRFFGRFVWGMDLLRENLEEQKIRELELQKEKKVLLLSLSHDIKTPLSAIKLYAKALSKNLYQEEGKKIEIAENINDKVDEIEGYISEIVKASNEDFLHFEVENEEFYIKEVLEEIREYYEDKMALNQIEFQVGAYRNCLVYGDKDRLVEVLQNIIENAIKYGDGKKIWLEMKREEEEYKILVFNTGCQLPDKELSHIFDSFFRGSNVEKKPGSGLGLYICRQLMHLMEGEVTAVLGSNGTGTMMVQVVVHRV